MALKEQVEESLHTAMRSKDELTKRTLRMVLAAIKLLEVEKGAKADDGMVLTILQKEVKSRLETISDAQKIDRQDIISAAREEISVLEKFLPSQLSDADLEKIIRDAITEIGASGIQDMGKVMRIALPKIQGRATPDRVSQLVKKSLG